MKSALGFERVSETMSGGDNLETVLEKAYVDLRVVRVNSGDRFQTGDVCGNANRAVSVETQALDDAINTRWKILPEEQRAGIKGFIVNKIIGLSSDEQSASQERTMIHQMNKVLVSILKQEWPHNWPATPASDGNFFENSTGCMEF